MIKIAVFGAGTWGIALARLLAVNGRDVTVWSAIPAELKSLSTTHRHPNLPGMELPSAMHYTLKTSWPNRSGRLGWWRCPVPPMPRKWPGICPR